jgi:hypothetical protein
MEQDSLLCRKDARSPAVYIREVYPLFLIERIAFILFYASQWVQNVHQLN